MTAKTESPEQRTARILRTQAMHCERLGSALYAGLLRHSADDLLAGGPTARVLEGHLADHARNALPLRMLGGVHALVLTGRAADLATFYPSAGGTADPGPGARLAWRALREVLDARGAEIRGWLPRPPQANEVGRGAALAGALCHLLAEADRPVRLVEVGTSAGLNLRADQFWISGAGVSYGPPSSPVRMPGAWRGKPPPVRQVQVISRTGGDLAPVDPVSDEGRLLLLAYVWADQVERLERLRGACDLAARIPAELRRESASQTIASLRLEPGTWTVLWHSIFQQYLDTEEIRELADGVARLGATATESARFAHVTLELVRAGPDTPVEVTTWPGGACGVIGSALPHGIPVTWTA
ncbi:MAG: DUF2332 domain-containing protein [Streptosporangiaceae bacterium]